MKKPIGFALALLVTASVASLAQTDHSGHSGHHGATDAAASEAVKALEAVNAKMHQAMVISYTGDADVDFVRSMIPHHQGAIDMAKILLRHGKNAETKKLAAEIIAAQEKEIAWMEDWLKRNAK